MNKNIKKIFVLGCFLFLFALSVKPCLAQLPTENELPSSAEIPDQSETYQLNVPLPGIEGEVTLPKYIKAVYQFGIGALAILAMGMIMIAGYQYMFSAGDNITKTSDAKARIKNALIGLFIALTSFLLLNTINPEILTGIEEAQKIQKQDQQTDKKSKEGQYCNNSIGFNCEAGLKCSAVIGDGVCIPEGDKESGVLEINPNKSEPGQYLWGECTVGVAESFCTNNGLIKPIGKDTTEQRIIDLYYKCCRSGTTTN